MIKFDVVAARKYEKVGEQKTHWINVGEATQWDDGNISIRLSSVPVGGWWDGTLKLFERKPKEDAKPAQQPSRPPLDDDFGDDIPFS